MGLDPGFWRRAGTAHGAKISLYSAAATNGLTALNGTSMVPALRVAWSKTPVRSQ